MRGMFRGLTSTWAREVPGYFFFFGGYNGSLKLLSPAGEYRDHLSVWRLALAGGLAGCCFWTAIFPADVVKSRVQVCVCEFSDITEECVCLCRLMNAYLAHSGFQCFKLSGMKVTLTSDACSLCALLH